VDNLDSGLAFVDCLSINASPGLSTSLVGGFTDACVDGDGSLPSHNPIISNAGQQATFSLGDITNSDTNNSTSEMVTLVYQVVVLNGFSNDRGDLRHNSAVFGWNNGTPHTHPAVSASDVTIVEPTLRVVKTANPTTGDADDLITFQIVVSHAAGSNAAAYNVSLTDLVNTTYFTYTVGSLVRTAGLVPTTLSDAGAPNLTATWDSFPTGSSSTLRFTVRLKNNVYPGLVITNTGNAQWTSLPGSVLTPQSPYSGVSTERTGNTLDPGGADNDYQRLG
jgi:hypothetical protein